MALAFGAGTLWAGPRQPAGLLPSAEAKGIIEKRAREAIRVLAQKDIQHLARLVHPDKGLIFSAYPGIQDLEFAIPKRKVAQLSFSDPKVFQAVAGDGSGIDKDYSFAEYYGRFVYDHDYAKAPQVAYDEYLAEGNCAIDLDRNFKGSIIVEFHFAGFDPKSTGMDWKSLFLVFEKADDGQWYLVDIAHDEWCI